MNEDINKPIPVVEQFAVEQSIDVAFLHRHATLTPWLLKLDIAN